MSINRYRGKLNKANNNQEYKKIWLKIEFPLYWDECINLYPRLKTRGAKPPRKQIYSYQIRMYRTWKHNRKTQWK